MSGYKRVNFYELCRLCATNQQKDKTHIFQEEGRKIQLQNKIQSCLSLTVCENDFLPKVVCSRCLRTLEVCYTFRQECVSSESMLSSYFKNFRYTEDFKKSGKVYIKDTTSISKSPNQYQQIVETTPSSTPNNNQLDNLPFYTVQLPMVDGSKPVKPSEKSVQNQNLGYNLNMAASVKTGPKLATNDTSASLSNVVVNANGEVLNIAQLVDFESLMSQTPQKSKIGHSSCVKQPPKKVFKDCVGSTANTSPPNQQNVSPVIKIDLTRETNGMAESFDRKNKFASYTIKMEDNKVIFNNLQQGADYGGAPPVSASTSSSNFGSFSGNNSSYQNPVETSTVNLNVLSQELVGSQSFRSLVTNSNSNNNNNTHNNNNSSSSGGKLIDDSGSVKCHICEICQKSFKRREHLYQHVKLHTGFRPYTCENCNKSFMRKEHLLRHMTSHSGQKNFTCGICEKSFSRNDNLLKHKKTHDKQTSYTCEMCQKQFVMKHYYLAHKMTHESDRCTAAIAAASNVWNVLKT